jgi:hypothetical protein
VGVTEIDRLLESENFATPTSGPKVSVLKTSSSAVTPLTSVGWQKKPASGSPTKFSRGLSAVMRPGPGGAVDGVVVLYHVEEADEAVGEPLAEHRAVEHVLGHGVAYGGLLDPPGEPGDELVVDGLVDDGGAEGGAALACGAEAAEERALDGEVEVGVGHHDERVLAAELQARGLEVSAAELADLLAHLEEPVKPTLSTRPSSSAPSRPSKAAWPSHWTTFRTPSGRPPAWKSFARASPTAGEYSAGFQTTVLPQVSAGIRYHEGHGHGEVPGRDDRRHPDRHPEGEELLVRHLARAPSGRRGGGPRR